MNNKPTLEQLKKIEDEYFREMERIEKEILEPIKERWRNAYRAHQAVKKEIEIEAEVQRRLAEKGGA